MNYWERRFKHRLQVKGDDAPVWNRTLPRKRLLDRLPQGIEQKTILEIGCGSAATLYQIYGRNIPNYIGLDLSYYGCCLGQKAFPKGLFVQATAEKLPFRDASIDVLVAYGTLHHLPGHENNVSSLLSVLKSNGYLVGSDPLVKPRIPRPNLQKMIHFQANIDDARDEGWDLRTGRSPHNDRIDWNNLVTILESRATVLQTYREYSPLRSLLVQTLNDRMKMRAKIITRGMIVLDQMWLHTIGRFHGALGPAGIHYVIRKL